MDATIGRVYAQVDILYIFVDDADGNVVELNCAGHIQIRLQWVAEKARGLYVGDDSVSRIMQRQRLSYFQANAQVGVAMIIMPS